MNATPILQIRNISKSYSGIRVLCNVDFDLMAGEVHALVGENGAGKTTMIKIIAGVEEPDDGGQILFAGKQVTRMTAVRSMGLGVNVIYQDISLFPNLSIAENICKGIFRDPFVNRRKIRDRALQTLEAMNVSMDVNQRLEGISIGQKQIVAIARAVAVDAKVIVMDEPTAALSSSEVEMLYRVIGELKGKGVGIIYISHKLDEIFAVADRISVLRDGNMIATDIASAFDQKKLIRLMVGRELRFVPMHNEGGEGGEILFEVRDFTSEPSFRGISFKVRRGEIVGLTGLVGAGRSEWAQTVFGLRKLQRGDMSIHGKKVSVRDADDAISRGICYLPEDRRLQGLFQGNSMARNMTAVTLKKMVRRKLLSRSMETGVARKYIGKLSIRPELPDISVDHLSGGNQQKTLISRWLNADPKVLIVDEPTCGVDVGAKLEIHRLLRELAEHGVCVILISSDLSEVFALSDRILVMRQGAIVHEAQTHSATQEGILSKGLLG